MAKFTSTAALNMRWFGDEINGAAGATHRIPDALADEFAAAYQSSIPGCSWVAQDESTTYLTSPIAQVDVTGLTASLAAKADTSSLTSYVQTTALSAYAALGLELVDPLHDQRMLALAFPDPSRIRLGRLHRGRVLRNRDQAPSTHEHPEYRRLHITLLSPISQESPVPNDDVGIESARGGNLCGAV